MAAVDELCRVGVRHRVRLVYLIYVDDIELGTCDAQPTTISMSVPWTRSGCNPFSLTRRIGRVHTFLSLALQFLKSGATDSYIINLRLRFYVRMPMFDCDRGLIFLDGLFIPAKETCLL